MKCYTKCPDVLFRMHKALPVMDSMRAYITLKEKLKGFNSIPALIPGGLTKILQLRNISVNQQQGECAMQLSWKSLDGSTKHGLQ